MITGEKQSHNIINGTILTPNYKKIQQVQVQPILNKVSKRRHNFNAFNAKKACEPFQNRIDLLYNIPIIPIQLQDLYKITVVSHCNGCLTPFLLHERF